ncbi:imidazoleglycerol-phosphate dehydratase HisB [Betaproteobacteria bacterium]|nr:imidazoleglycerol-phosphate dehydratase HisB [Betaproteobacteria bacterium]
MRSAKVERNTGETAIQVQLALDDVSQGSYKTGLPFFDHMLDQISRHGKFSLHVDAEGDLLVDPHHTVEDIGITIGKALNKALGNKVGIKRFGSAYAPLDEALSRVVVDISGRPGLHFRCQWKRQIVGDFDLDLIKEFFQGFVNHAGITLHIENFYGDNAHHQCESIFKCFALALRQAVNLSHFGNSGESIPSTKGVL